METKHHSVAERLSLLGLACDEVPLDRLSSAIAALAAFPMYMVANVHAWAGHGHRRIPLIDIPSAAMIRESFVIGEAEARVEMSREHRHLLGTFSRRRSRRTG